MILNIHTGDKGERGADGEKGDQGFKGIYEVLIKN